ncbi:MAG: SseB family protein [Clostridiales bacterium]|nr:SseB family protein [Clostridiales bacterium]
MGTRFVLLAEDKFNYNLDSDDLTVVTGTVHGTVRKDDEVYVLDQSGRSVLTKVRQLESGNEHPDSCTDAPVAVVLEISSSELDKYSVITNIRPWDNEDVNSAVENPYLTGMLYGEKFKDDKLFFSKFVFALAHSRLLAPVVFSKNPEDNGNGTATLTEHTQISFPTLANPAFPGKATLAVYTDWTELNKWKDAPRDENNTVQTVILKFPDIVHLVEDPGMNGCVINAFGPTSFFMSTSMIDMITSLEGYRREFGESPKTDN